MRALVVYCESGRLSMKQQSLFAELPSALQNRLLLNAQWLTLVKKTLPSMAVFQNWPISVDHCFMRVCLDTALGAPWQSLIPRPAIKHLSDEQLTLAISVAQSLVDNPEKLSALNQQSIRWRRSQERRNNLPITQ
jgi:hypothetical protein